MNPSATVSALSFELQLEILHHLPPNQLFVLRRVSHAWNTMLTNARLLEAINATIPFLTSAPDLTSRMKRRMRMVRGEPVWVKPFEEVFPKKPNDYAFHTWQRFSDGWLVFLRGPRGGQKEPGSSPVITLTIRNLHEHSMHQVDILAVLNEVNPAVYKEWIEYYLGHVKGQLVEITQCYFSVQAGWVVVGLQASGPNGSEFSFAQGYWSRPHNKTIDCGTYFFIFSLKSRELIQHRYIPHSPTGDKLILTGLNATHAMYLHGREDKSSDSSSCQDDDYHGRTYAKYIISIYPLAANWSPQPKSYEIVITDIGLNRHLRMVESTTHGKGFTPFFFSDPNQQHGFGTGVVFDDLGRVWFPYLNSGIITTTVGNTPDEKDNIGRCIHMYELPRTGCSRWVILDPPAILSGLKSPEPVSPQPIVAFHSQPPSETAFGSYHKCLQMVEFPVREPGTWDRPDSVRIQKFIPNTHRALPRRGCAEMHIRIPSKATQSGFWPHDPRKIYNSLIEETPATWGFMVPPGYLSGEDKGQADFFKNVYLMPFRGYDNERKPREGGYTWEEAEAAGWTLIGNGLPPDCVPPIRDPTNESSSVRWSWGDDGLFCLLIMKMDQRIIRRHSPHITATQWIVCYEEDWSM